MPSNILRPRFFLQVSPTEVEDVIMQLPEVADAAVIGVPHERLGEAPLAFVVAKAKVSPEKVNRQSNVNIIYLRCYVRRDSCSSDGQQKDNKSIP